MASNSKARHGRPLPLSGPGEERNRSRACGPNSTSVEFREQERSLKTTVRRPGHRYSCPGNAVRRQASYNGKEAVMAHGVYLVGSVPMKDAETVFTEVSRALGPLVKRIPDGETGNRLDWVAWLEPVFARSPALMKTDQFFRIHA